MPECKHHWHDPIGSYWRGSKRGWKQAKCCICHVRAWIKLLRPPLFENCKSNNSSDSYDSLYIESVDIRS